MKRRVFINLIAYVLIPILVVAVMIWVMLYPYRPHESEEHLRERLEAVEALPVLKRWALERVSSQKWEGFTEKEKLPLDAQMLGIVDLAPVQSPDGRIVYIAIVFGAGFRHYGIYVGPPGFRPEASPWPYLNRWCDQVWYYDEIPRRN
jgi:hypothetical protein